MRESLHYNMIPLPQDNMNDIIFNGSRRILTNVSSHAYYGYQPQIHIQEKHNSQITEMASETCDMDVQYNNLTNGEEKMQTENGIPRHVNRKRRWEYPDELDEFKKRRQNENNCTDNEKDIPKEDKETTILEDILRETHGVSIYHWMCNDAS